MAFAALGLELPIFLPLAIAVVAGDSVAGEANIGTLRYLLTIPVVAAQYRRRAKAEAATAVDDPAGPALIGG